VNVYLLLQWNAPGVQLVPLGVYSTLEKAQLACDPEFVWVDGKVDRLPSPYWYSIEPDDGFYIVQLEVDALPMVAGR